MPEKLGNLIQAGGIDVDRQWDGWYVRPMDGIAELPKREYKDINRNRRRLMQLAYEVYPEFAYCDPDAFNWHEAQARTNIFDLYYLADCGLVVLTKGPSEGHRRPDFFMLSPAGADLVEIPGRLDEKFPVRHKGKRVI
ncbi:MAG: hypothetical protein JW950_10210 [Deltaproteobacteria bacterium]|nr:hypothetical protein [Deltaproteobacteria bacterium]